MLFKPEHMEPLLSDRMTQIRKIWEKPMVKVGSVHEAKTALFSRDCVVYAVSFELEERYESCISTADVGVLETV